VNPYEPTQRPQAFHDTWTRADFYIPPPPPPPKPPSRWRYLWAAILLSVGIVIVGAFAYNAILKAAQSIVRTITPTASLATATPTPEVSITAAKVYAVFESHGLAKGGAEDDTAYDAALGKLRPVGGTVDFTDVQTQQPYTISVFATAAAATRASDILFNGGDNVFIANGTCMLHVAFASRMTNFEADQYNNLMRDVCIATSTAAKPPAVTGTPTTNATYTAVDIMQDFNAVGIHPKFVEYNRTISSWTADTYSVAATSTSSVDLTDDSGCTGPCSPQDIGVWVYSKATTAQQAHMEVANDEAHQGEIPMMGKPAEYVHGRCLLLGADANSIYWQIVTQYCV
jgi:hypothetical protein